MSPYQQALCELVARSCQEQGLKGVSIHNPVMELRNVCNHPFISKLHVQERHTKPTHAPSTPFILDSLGSLRKQ